MPGPRQRCSAATEASARRTVVPTAAARSLWLAAIWTGAGAAVLCATVAIIAVAVLWLPVSGPSGRAHSAIHAGVLTFLAALHGGITIDGSAAAFLPLGMTLIVAVTAWRAGAALADTAAVLGERDAARLGLAAAAQAASFTVCCLVAVPFATLGTSGAPFLGVGLAALLLSGVAGGAAVVRHSGLRERCAVWLPAGFGAAARGAAAVLAVYVAASALLVAAALVLNHARVERISAQVGGGWGGIPLLLLGILAAPNAVIAAVAYLAGPGFVVGTGTAISAFGSGHGVLPAFPLLGALPQGQHASVPVWCLAAITPLAAGGALARIAGNAGGWRARLQGAGLALGLVAAVLLVLGWLAGGGIGDGHLAAIGPSPWQLALAVPAATAVVAAAGLGLSALRGRWRVPFTVVFDSVRDTVPSGSARTEQATEDEPAGRDKLAG